MVSGYLSSCNRLKEGADSDGDDADSGDDDEIDCSGSERPQLIPEGLDPPSFRLKRRFQVIIRSDSELVASVSDYEDLKRKRDEDADAEELPSDKRPKHALQRPSARKLSTHYNVLERKTASKVFPASLTTSYSTVPSSASPAARPAAHSFTPPRLGLDDSPEDSAPRRRSSRIKGQPKQTKK